MKVHATAQAQVQLLQRLDKVRAALEEIKMMEGAHNRTDKK